MAKIRFGPVVEDARGSIAGVTYSRNRFGAYARDRVAPINPKTSFQTAVRNNLTDLAKFWRDITEAQRTGWSELGAQLIRTDSIGQTHDLTGFQAYQSINGTRLAIGDARIDDAPALDNTPQLLTIGFSWSLGIAGFALTYTATGATAAERWLLFATQGVSAGRSFFRKSEYKFIADYPGDEASPIDAEAEYTARFALPNAGEKVSLLFVPVSANRIQGTPVRVDAIVTT